jgi:hypothetical protein
MAEVVTVSPWPRIMGTSSGMLESHHGTLIDTALDAILSRPEGFGAWTGTADAPGAQTAWNLERAMGLEPTILSLGS